MKIKEIIIPFSADFSTDSLDVLIQLEDDKYSTDDFCYVVEVTTPEGVAYLMEGENFLPPTELMLIVKELSKEIIEKAVQALVEAKDDAYWLKLYHAAGKLDINHLNAGMQKLKDLAME